MSRCEHCYIFNTNEHNHLTDQELTRIANCKISQNVMRNEVIFEEDEILEGVYCIKKGVAKLIKIGEKGKDHILKLASVGNVIGSRSIINKESTKFSATAVTDMELCFIPKSEVMTDLQENVEFTLNVLQRVTQNLEESDNQIVNIVQKSLPQRLAETILYVMNHFGVDEENVLKLSLTREEYSSIVGATTESIIRTLSEFKKEKLITTNLNSQIKIESTKGLMRVI